MGENANNLNAHAPPPSEIKDIFKKYQKLKVEEIDLDPSILDFSRAELPDGCVPTRTINGLKLASTIQDFLGAGSSVQSPIEAAPIYSDTRLPGRDTVLLSCVVSSSFIVVLSMSYWSKLCFSIN